jgi:surface protein
MKSRHSNLLMLIILIIYPFSLNAQSDVKFYLAENGVTIMCPDAAVGETGEVGGVTYEAVDRALLIQRRDEGANLTRVCTSPVTDLSEMFYGFTDFNQPIGSWDVSNVSSTRRTFSGKKENLLSNTFNQKIELWNVSKVTDMSGMFAYSEFNQSIGNWNVSAVINMEAMFINAENFNSDLSRWNVNQVTNMQSMFMNASAFNSDIYLWNIQNVKLMDQMFRSAKSFNHSLGHWNYSGITADGLVNFITDAGLTAFQYDLLLKNLVSNQTIPDQLRLNASGLFYCDDINRQKIASSNALIITGDVQLAKCAEKGDYNTGMVAFYPFNGNAEESTGNGINGVVDRATLTKDRFGIDDSAYSFDLDQNIYIPNSSHLNLFPLTMSLWLNLGELQGHRIGKVFGKYWPASWNGFNIFAQTYEVDGRQVNRIVPWFIRNQSNRVLGQYGEPNFETYVEKNEWHHIVVIFDESGGRIYLDGELSDYHPWTGVPGPTSSSFLWQIGGIYDDAFTGKLDDIRIYNRSLIPSEVYDLYVYESQFSSNPVQRKIFSADLTISNALNHEIILSFGFSPAATNGFDENLDLYAPPAPPAGALDARFINQSEAYFRDFRPISDYETVWQLRVSSEDALPLRISWDANSLPEDGTIVIRDAIDGSFINYDMQSVNQLEINQEFIKDLLITYRLNSKIEINLTEKWNLISLPVLRSEPIRYFDLLPDAVSGTLYGFADTYVLNDVLTPGESYWIRMSRPVNLTVSGRHLDAIDIELRKGWNMIAGPSIVVTVGEILDPDKIIVEGSLFGYSGAYSNISTFEPGKGYWIRAKQPGSIRLGGEIRNKNPVVDISDILKGFSRIDFLSTDDDFVLSSLFLAGTIPSRYSVMNFELPPVPPGGLMDVRWEDDTYVNESMFASAIIQQQERVTRLKLSDIPGDNKNINRSILVREYSYERFISEVELRSSEFFSLSHETNKVVIEVLESFEKPTEFALSQNFPNPFNPSTTIRYALPEAAQVRLEVYTVTGQRVATLASGEQNAGWHAVDFDGSGLASGVYVYRLQAGGFVQTRKLMLIK